MADPDGMVYWLAEACLAAREARGRKPVHIAAELSMEPTSVRRFERHETTFAALERFVNAYAADLGIDARELWRDALERWEAADRGA